MDKKMIIVINGKGGIGKDSLINALSCSGVSVENVSAIDPIKDMVEFLNEKGIKDLAYRHLLADVRYSVDEYYKQENGVAYSTHYLGEAVKDWCKLGADDVLFVHIREPENIIAFLEEAKKRLMLRGEKEAVLTTLLIRSDRAQESYGNAADDGVEDYAYDFTFESNGDKREDGERFVQYFHEVMQRKE